MTKGSTQRNMSELNELVRQRIAARRRETEELTADELQKLAAGLKRRVGDVLTSTSADLETTLNKLRTANRSLGRTFLWRWAPPLLLGAALAQTIHHIPALLEMAAVWQSRDMQFMRAAEEAGLIFTIREDGSMWMSLPTSGDPKYPTVKDSAGGWWFRLKEG